MFVCEETFNYPRSLLSCATDRNKTSDGTKIIVHGSAVNNLVGH